MSNPNADTAAQLLYPANVQFNAARVYTIKFISACFAGAVAGTLGLEAWLGFGLFVLSTLLTSACLYVKCKAKPAKYMPGGFWELVNPGQENMFSFLLVWTLFYGTSETIRPSLAPDSSRCE
jgi:ER membrane protein complex subunit 6